MTGLSVAEESPGARKYMVGVLTPAAVQWNEKAFRTRLQELGYVEGVNLELDIRSGGGRLERRDGLARELVRRHPDVIVGVNTPGTRAARKETSTIPIVMAMIGDPVGLGFVTNLARPEGNVTGVSNMVGELAGKRLQLLLEAVPAAKRIALLYHPDEPIVEPQVRDLEAAGKVVGVQFRMYAVRKASDLARAFEDAAEWRAEAILQLAGQAQLLRRETVDHSLQRRIPIMVHSAAGVELGGLLSYYVNDGAAYRRVAEYVDRILKGAHPSALPVEQPARFEMVVNLRTARTLGINIPQVLLLRADRVIE